MVARWLPLVTAGPLLLLVGSASGQPRTIVRSDHFVHEVAEVERSEFTPQRLQKRAREFGERYKTVEFAKLLIGTGPEMKDYVGKGATHQTVESYFYQLPLAFPEGLRTWPRLAMVIKVGPAVLLRVRDEGRVTVTVVLGDRAALPGMAKGYEILDFAPKYDPPELISGAEVFVRTRHMPTQSEVESIADALCGIRPGWRFHVFARQDSWFIQHVMFPFLYAFDEGYKLPTREEYRDEPEIWALREPCPKP